MKKILILILFITCQAYAQQNKTDSLLSVLKTEKEDTAKVNTLNAFAREFRSNNPDTAIYFANEAMSLATKLNYKMGIAASYQCIGVAKINLQQLEDALNNLNKAMAIYDQLLVSETGEERNKIIDQKGRTYSHLGNAYYLQGNFSEAMKAFSASLKINEETGDKPGTASDYNNLGVIYAEEGNYPEALKVQLAGLKIREAVHDTLGMAASYSNIGNVYDGMKNFPEALKNHIAALKIWEGLGEINSVADAYNNIGIVYAEMFNFPEALKNHMASLEIKKESGDQMGIAASYSSIGLVYQEQNNFPEALRNYFASLKISEEIGDTKNIANIFTELGNIYTKQKKYSEARVYLEKGLMLSKKMGSLEHVYSTYSAFTKLDSAMGNYKDAFDHHKLYITYRDSLFNEENTKKLVQVQMQYDFDKKESLARAQQEKKDVIALKKIQKQKLVRNGFIGGFAVMLLFALIFLIQRNKISKERKISEVEKKRSEELLLNILPAEVAEELKKTGGCQAKTFSMVTVMFADFKDFTRVSEKVSAELLVGELNFCFSRFDNILQQHKIEKIKTVGDAYLCVSGLPTLNYTHAFDVVSAAIEMKNFILDRKKEKEGKGEIAFEIRIGIHTGPVVAGIVGIKKYSYDIWGDTVNLAARMESSCEPGNVNISGSTYELVKDKFTCIHRGKIEAKNKGEVDMYFVERIS